MMKHIYRKMLEIAMLIPAYTRVRLWKTKPFKSQIFSKRQRKKHKRENKSSSYDHLC